MEDLPFHVLPSGSSARKAASVCANAGVQDSLGLPKLHPYNVTHSSLENLAGNTRAYQSFSVLLRSLDFALIPLSLTQRT